MKTAKFLLTAFASLAFSTAALAQNTVAVAEWVPQDPVAAEPLLCKGEVK